MSDTVKIGDVQTDEDGTRWIVVALSTENGVTKASRVREGSLADHVHRPGDAKEEA